MEPYIKKSVCLKYTLDSLNNRYLYCVCPTKESADDLSWCETIYGEIPIQQHIKPDLKNDVRYLINHLKEQGIWRDFHVNITATMGGRWHEVIGMAEVKKSASIDTKIYMKVIDGVFKKEANCKPDITNHLAI